MAVKRKRMTTKKKKDIYGLTSKQWKFLEEIFEEQKENYEYDDDREELEWIVPLLEHIKQRRLTLDDMDKLIDMMDAEAEYNGDEGDYQLAAMYDSIEDKLIEAWNKLKKS